jgi:hypothetical protein
MTRPQLTDAESSLIQWLANTVSLPSDVETVLARRLAGMRAAPPSRAEGIRDRARYCATKLEAWDKTTGGTVAESKASADVINAATNLCDYITATPQAVTP